MNDPPPLETRPTAAQQRTSTVQGDTWAEPRQADPRIEAVKALVVAFVAGAARRIDDVTLPPSQAECDPPSERVIVAETP